MNQPIINERYDRAQPMSIGDMRMGGTPTTSPVVQQSRVSTPVLIAGGVAVLIGVSALASYLYQEKKEHDQLALSPVVTQPSPEAQSGSTPPTAPTAQDSPSTQPLDTLSKEKEQNSMPLAGQANNHSSESLEPAKRASAPTQRTTPRASTAPSKSQPATKAPASETQPTIAPEPVKEPEILKSEPPATPPKDDKSGMDDKTGTDDKTSSAP